MTESDAYMQNGFLLKKK